MKPRKEAMRFAMDIAVLLSKKEGDNEVMHVIQKMLDIACHLGIPPGMLVDDINSRFPVSTGK